MSQPRREWKDAIEKRDAEPGCRVCGSLPVEAAHVVGRRYDRPVSERSKTLYVHPDSVVGLCPDHHRAYDAHTLDLISYLHAPEQIRAVEDLQSIESARRRLAPSEFLTTGKELP